jgi:hypothetical protein
MQNMPRLYYDFLAIADVACWCICFWWMHRISRSQNAMLEQLRKQAKELLKAVRSGDAAGHGGVQHRVQDRQFAFAPDKSFNRQSH